MPAPRHWLFAALGLMLLSVIWVTELPLFSPSNPNFGRLWAGRFLLIPHVGCGLFMLLAGPFQFSNRLRRAGARWHRYVGRVYMMCVVLAALSSVALSPPLSQMARATVWVQSILWLASAGGALSAARNGRFERHRRWAVRNYAVSAVFVLSRFPNFVPAWAGMSDGASAWCVMLMLLCCFALPDFYFDWVAAGGVKRRAAEAGHKPARRERARRAAPKADGVSFAPDALQAAPARANPNAPDNGLRPPAHTTALR